MGLRPAAALWGLAEATLFFIVPDVLLSAVALRDRTLALRLCLWTLCGAIAGGMVMYLWGRNDVERATEVLGTLPAISQAMLAGVGKDLAELGALATFFGPLTGTPYKLYAALSPQAEISLTVFALVSIPARLIRFVLIATLTAWIARTVLRDWSDRNRLGLLLTLWGLFYIGYFLAMPWN